MYSWFCFQERGNASRLNEVDEIIWVNFKALKQSCSSFFREKKVLDYFLKILKMLIK